VAAADAPSRQPVSKEIRGPWNYAGSHTGSNTWTAGTRKLQ
jgi:hypothetical protein